MLDRWFGSAPRNSDPEHILIWTDAQDGVLPGHADKGWAGDRVRELADGAWDLGRGGQIRKGNGGILVGNRLPGRRLSLRGHGERGAGVEARGRRYAPVLEGCNLGLRRGAHESWDAGLPVSWRVGPLSQVPWSHGTETRFQEDFRSL
jgi:hypothetical protein